MKKKKTAITTLQRGFGELIIARIINKDANQIKKKITYDEQSKIFTITLSLISHAKKKLLKKERKEESLSS